MLSVRPTTQSLPSYSLTSDLLNFNRCPRQYRYTKIAKLPSSLPTQLWYGNLIHGVLEECHLKFKESTVCFPWPEEELEEIIETVDRHLAASQICAWTDHEEVLGKRRVHTAVNELGPYLFPLIQQAEVRLRGARALAPTSGASSQSSASDINRYEMLGVVDVVTEMSLNQKTAKANPLLALIKEAMGTTRGKFEVIVDYKGSVRPDLPSKKPGGKPSQKTYKKHYKWQVHTYAYLRSLMTKTPIKAGILIYLNELHPTVTDMKALRKATKNKTPDVLVPAPGSADEAALLAWKPSTKAKPPKLSFEFRLQRAVQVFPISQKSTQEALEKFDQTVAEIESCMSKELATADLLNSWPTDASEEDTCNICDSKTYCEAYTKMKKPSLPK